MTARRPAPGPVARARTALLAALALTLAACAADAPEPAPASPAPSIGAARQAQLDAAADAYLEALAPEVETLVTLTDAVADAVAAGDQDAARALYPDARRQWRTVEPAARHFPDLMARLDLREADLGAQELWTGWHALEKALWPGEDAATPPTPAVDLAAALREDTATLAARLRDPAVAPAALAAADGATATVNDVSATTVAGTDEIWSDAGLAAIAGAADGARLVVTALGPLAEQSDPALVATVEDRLDALDALLARWSVTGGFAAMSSLADDDVLALARALEAVAEPLSRLGAAAALG